MLSAELPSSQGTVALVKLKELNRTAQVAYGITGNAHTYTQPTLMKLRHKSAFEERKMF